MPDQQRYDIAPWYDIAPKYDVVVVGAGTAGIPCALAAAEAGARVLLLEKDPARHQALVRKFVAIAYDEVPRVPLFQPLLDVAMQRNISGYQYWFHRQLDLRQLQKN